MKTTTTHTPTPWHVRYKHDTHQVHRDPMGRIIDDVKVPFEDYQYARHCVNTHAALVAALELAKATIERLDKPHGAFSSCQGTYDVINQALATGKE